MKQKMKQEIISLKNMNLIELISKKHKKFCRDLNYVERLLIFFFLQLLYAFPFLLLVH